MDTRLTIELRPHPENEKIYGDHADSELIESVRSKGILNPLLVTSNGTIINGHRRYEAARRIGMQRVPVVTFNSNDPHDILEALIESNRQRNKTNEQVAREAQALLLIEVERADKRRLAGKKPDLPQPVVDGKGESNRVVGEKLGTSHEFVRQSVAVVNAIDSLRESGKQREAEQLRSTLNQSAKKAYEVAKEAGHITPTQRPQKQIDEPKPKSSFSVPEWEALSDTERQTILMSADGASKFNAQETNNIEWAMWSWNPVTGCKHNCPYCYARDIAERFYEQKFEPTFLPDRLTAPFNTKVPFEAVSNIGHKNVFTCSMADLFGRWVPSDWIQAVLDTVASAPQWNFLFLTKFPIRMSEFEFPDNAWVGTSVDCQARVRNAEEAFKKVNAKVKWLSCEPLLEPLQFTNLDMFNWIVLGGASKSTQTPEWRPPRAWINDIEKKAHEAGCMVYEKTNLLERVREYPGQELTADVQLPAALQYLARAEK